MLIPFHCEIWIYCPINLYKNFVVLYKGWATHRKSEINLTASTLAHSLRLLLIIGSTEDKLVSSKPNLIKLDATTSSDYRRFRNSRNVYVTHGLWARPHWIPRDISFRLWNKGFRDQNHLRMEVCCRSKYSFIQDAVAEVIDPFRPSLGNYASNCWREACRL